MTTTSTRSRESLYRFNCKRDVKNVFIFSKTVFLKCSYFVAKVLGYASILFTKFSLDILLQT